MYTVRRTDEFANWLDSLKDRMTRVRLIRRLEKAMKKQSGRREAGWQRRIRDARTLWSRLADVLRNPGELLIVMVGGGTKAKQSADIGKAIRLADLLEG